MPAQGTLTLKATDSDHSRTHDVSLYSIYSQVFSSEQANLNSLFPHLFAHSGAGRFTPFSRSSLGF